MLNKKNIIVDERQELQGLKNAKLTLSIMLLLLGLCICIEIAVYGDPAYFWPETLVLLICALTNLFLDIKHGLFYTSDNQNSKRNMILYISAAFVSSGILTAGNFLKYQYAPFKVIILFPITFFITLGLMLALDSTIRSLTKKRMKNLECTGAEDEEN